MGLFDTVKKIVIGDVAHDAADSGNPIKIGGKARTSLPAAVSANDRVDAYFDAYGRLVVVPPPDTALGAGFRSGVLTSGTDILCNASDNTYSAAVAPSNAFFDGADVGFGSGFRYMYFPRKWGGQYIGLYTNLNTGLDLSVYGLMTGHAGLSVAGYYHKLATYSNMISGAQVMLINAASVVRQFYLSGDATGTAFSAAWNASNKYALSVGTYSATVSADVDLLVAVASTTPAADTGAIRINAGETHTIPTDQLTSDWAVYFKGVSATGTARVKESLTASPASIVAVPYMDKFDMLCLSIKPDGDPTSGGLRVTSLGGRGY